MDKKAKEIYEAVSRLYQKVTARSQHQALVGDNVKLNPVDVDAIMFVGSNPDCIVSDLGNYLEVVPTTTSSIVERLVQRQVLDRLRTDKNRRVVILRLTEKGEEIYLALMERRVEVFQKTLDRLTTGEKTTLSVLMEKLSSSGAASKHVRSA